MYARSFSLHDNFIELYFDFRSNFRDAIDHSTFQIEKSRVTSFTMLFFFILIFLL